MISESSWNAEDSTPIPVVAILVSVSVGCAVVAILTSVCLIVMCRRKGGPVPPTPGPAHWSTTVTVTPECRPREPLARRQEQDRRREYPATSSGVNEPGSEEAKVEEAKKENVE